MWYKIGLSLLTIAIIASITLSFAEREKGAILLPESILEEIYMKLDELSQIRQVKDEKAMEKILVKLDEISKALSEIKEDLYVIKIRVTRR